jgi:hypothetical protein
MVSSPSTERLLVDTFIMFIVGSGGGIAKDAMVDAGGKDQPGDVAGGGAGGGGGPAGGGAGSAGSPWLTFADESNALFKVRSRRLGTCCTRDAQHSFWHFEFVVSE